ncbi:reverse transcriptase domain-containing protein [Tanacetum coccineum]
MPKETLYVYLAASQEAVSARNYSPLEKLTLALRHVSRRLRRYFEAHLIKVITNQPIKQILDKAEASGKLANYSIELGEYEITYEPRNAIKGQVLADFINEVSVGSGPLIPWHTPYTAGDKYSSRRGRGQLDDPHHQMPNGRKMARRPKQSKETTNENQPIHHGGRGSLQNVIPNAYASVSVVAKAIRHGYYWPTMHRDAREEIRKCDSCQIHSPVPKLPKTLMTSIMAPWPFFQWGMDVLGPLPEALRKVKFVIMAIDYFTKWIEAKPLAKLLGKK